MSRNLFTIALMLLASFALMIPLVSAASYCCVSDNSCIDYGTDDPSLCSSGTWEEGACSTIAECTGTTGCCCSGSGSESTSKYACSLNEGTFHPGEEDQCAQICGETPDPVETISCDNYEDRFEFSIDDVKGQRELLLSWNTCEDVSEVTLERRSGAGSFTPVTTLLNQQSTYRDGSVEWGTTYVYRITVQYSGGTIEELVEEDTGDALCEGETTSYNRCTGDDSTVYRCSVENEYLTVDTCEAGQCREQATGASCLGQASVCERNSAYLSVATSEFCEGLGDGNTCYYDRSSTGINGCFACLSVTSCYDFKSEFACGQAESACGFSGCVWEDLPDGSGAGLGAGVCKPADTSQNICGVLNNPISGANTGAYSPLLTPTSESFGSERDAWFSAASNPNQCTVAPIGSCITSTAALCDSVDTGSAPYGCAVRDDYCAKNGYDDPYFIDVSEGFLCDPDDTTCERDDSAPVLRIQRQIDYAPPGQVRYVPIVEDEINGAYRRIDDLDGYTFSICVVAVGGNPRSCDNPLAFSISSLDDGAFTYSFEELGLDGTSGTPIFKAIVRDPGYNTGNVAEATGAIDPTNPGPVLTLEPVPGEIDGHQRGAVNARGTWSGSGSGRVIIGTDSGETQSTISNGETKLLLGSWTYNTPYTGRLVVQKNGRDYESEPVTFTLEEPTFWIEITSPNKWGGVTLGEPMTIDVRTSERASQCRYAITEDETAPGYTDMTTTLDETSSGTWSETVNRALDGWLHVACQQFSGSQGIATASLPINVEEKGVVPVINSVEIEPGTTLIFANDDDSYSATLRITTSTQTYCSYTLDGMTRTTDAPARIENTLDVTFFDEGEYSFDVVCANAIGQESNPKQVTIAVDPSASWFGWLAPTGAVRSAQIPYLIATGASGITARCDIPELDVQDAQGQEIAGEFAAADLGGDGTYTLSATCIGIAQSGETTDLETITTSFTVDTAPPQVTARLNGHEGRFTVGTVPEDPYVSVSYSDASSHVVRLTYEVLEKPASAPASTIAGPFTLPSVPSSPANIPLDFSIRADHEYFVRVQAEDAAGNIQEIESNRMVADLPSQCENGIRDGDETDVDCGGACGNSCMIGQICQDDADCAGGSEATCTSENVCGYAYCSNGEQDTARGETGVDCGGACGACTIDLVTPSFGVSAEARTEVIVETTEAMRCTWDGYLFEPTGGTTHRISELDISPSRTINVSCVNDRLDVWEVFTLRHDPTQPDATFYANPDIEVAKKQTSEGARYVTAFTVTSDVPVVCRMSETDEDYADMTDYLGSDYTTDQDGSSYRKIQNEEFGFEQIGTYRRYVECVAKNGLETGTMSATFTADPNAAPEPIIRVPISTKRYADASITTMVDGQSGKTAACWGQLEDFEARSMARAQGNVYTLDVNLVEGTRVDYSATCSYALSTISVNGTDSVRFTVDQTPPEVNSATILDPHTGDTSLLNSLHAIEVDIDADDEITSVVGYGYDVSVNGATQANGTRTRGSFVINTLNLANGDEITATLSVTDAVGNTVEVQSNTLTVERSAPEHCTNGVRDGDETSTDCGGLCGACGDERACGGDADCRGGSYCSADDTCQPVNTICTNGRFDASYETDTDCGGICGACSEGGSCSADTDCASGMYCSTGNTCLADYEAICGNGVLDADYESDVDCGDLCESMLDRTCSTGSTCNTNADCSGETICVGGVCTNEFASATNSWCSADEFGNVIGAGTFCGRGCAEACTEGVGCQLSSDCASGLVCGDDGVCVEEGTAGGAACIPTDPNPRKCGGDCEQCGPGRQCLTGSDCTSGVCEGGLCRVGGSGTTTPTVSTGLIGTPCNSDGSCDDGRCNNENMCVEKRSVWKWIIFFLLIALLAVAGYIAYLYYYLPNKKPDYQENQPLSADTAQTGFDEQSGSEASVNPPQAPPVMTDKQRHVSELIRRKRAEEKEKQREKLFSAFDDSELDEPAEPVDPNTVKKARLDASKEDEKPVVPVRKKKSHDTFKEILDDAKNSFE